MSSKRKDLTINTFSQRQLTVLKCWAEAEGTEHAAELLGISKYTLQTHLKRMRKKIGVKRTVEVFVYAKKNKML